MNTVNNFFLSDNELLGHFRDAFTEFRKRVQKPTILIPGLTDKYKPSLIRFMFGQDMDVSSKDDANAKGFHTYASEHIPIDVIASKGIERLEQESGNLFDRKIHMVWYFISDFTERSLYYDYYNIEYLVKERMLPTCIIYTPDGTDVPPRDVLDMMQTFVSEKFGNRIRSFQISAKKVKDHDIDWNPLMEWSVSLLKDKEELRRGFIVSQRLNIDLKDEEARERNKSYRAAAGALGAAPTSYSMNALSSLQIWNAADLFCVYGFDNCIQGDKELMIQIGRRLMVLLNELCPTNSFITADVAKRVTVYLIFGLWILTRRFHMRDETLTSEKLHKLFSEKNISRLIEELKKKQSEEPHLTDD